MLREFIQSYALVLNSLSILGLTYVWARHIRRDR